MGKWEKKNEEGKKREGRKRSAERKKALEEGEIEPKCPSERENKWEQGASSSEKVA